MLAAEIGEAIRNYHKAVEENLLELGHPVCVQDEGSDSLGIPIDVMYDNRIFHYVINIQFRILVFLTKLCNLGLQLSADPVPVAIITMSRFFICSHLFIYYKAWLKRIINTSCREVMST